MVVGSFVGSDDVGYGAKKLDSQRLATAIVWTTARMLSGVGISTHQNYLLNSIPLPTKNAAP